VPGTCPQTSWHLTRRDVLDEHRESESAIARPGILEINNPDLSAAPQRSWQSRSLPVPERRRRGHRARRRRTTLHLRGERVRSHPASLVSPRRPARYIRARPGWLPSRDPVCVLVAGGTCPVRGHVGGTARRPDNAHGVPANSKGRRSRVGGAPSAVIRGFLYQLVVTLTDENHKLFPPSLFTVVPQAKIVIYLDDESDYKLQSGDVRTEVQPFIVGASL